MLPISLTIMRHGVPTGETGLSPFQRRLLDDPTPIRICAAPTGAGKSYGFVRASVEDDANVVFVVPTRRLAQNLARSLIDDLIERGLSVEDAQKRLAIWTSDERAKLKDTNPDLDVGRLRVRQMQFYELPEKGSFIIATPESLGYWLLNPPFANNGSAPSSIYELLQRDHIVFDEFHTIDPRGFGLAAAVCRIAAALSDAGHCCKVTFLSATPITIRHTLEAFEVPSEKIAEFSETIISVAGANPDLRILHGDVEVTFEDSASMLALCQHHTKRIVETLERARKGQASAKNRQVVILFDSLESLMLEREKLMEHFAELGVPRTKIMHINSIDDMHISETGERGTRGRAADPLDAWVIFATSSVEMGVTFHADVMVTDAGFNTMSLVQRVGRVARGDVEGLVVIRIPKRAPWFTFFLKSVHTEVAAYGPGVSVERFVEMALAKEKIAFKGTTDLHPATSKHTFDSLPLRAVWCAAVFWAALDGRHLRRGQRGSLDAMSPKKARAVQAMLREVRSGGRLYEKWVDAFLWQARKMRSIEGRVKVLTPKGNEIVPYSMWARNQDLRDAPTVEVGADNTLFSVRIGTPLEQALGTRDGQRPKGKMEVLVPGTPQAREVSSEPEAAISEWEKWVKRSIQGCGSLDPAIRSLEKALLLVRLTRIVPEPLEDRDMVKGLEGGGSMFV